MLRKGRRLVKPVAWLGYLIEGHLASLIGAQRYLTGSSRLSWSHASDADHGRQFVPLMTRVGKRVFDVVLASFVLIVTMPGA